MQIPPLFQNILNPPPLPEIKSCKGPLFFHPTFPFLPHTHNSPTSLLHSTYPLPFPPPHTHTTPQSFFYFFTPPPPPPPPHAPNFQPTQCNQEYCSILDYTQPPPSSHIHTTPQPLFFHSTYPSLFPLPPHTQLPNLFSIFSPHLPLPLTQIPPLFQNILKPPPPLPEIKSCKGPLFFHPTSPFLPHI